MGIWPQRCAKDPALSALGRPLPVRVLSRDRPVVGLVQRVAQSSRRISENGQYGGIAERTMKSRLLWHGTSE